MSLGDADQLGDVRPGRQPGWWLREALAVDPGLPVAPLTSTTADVAIVGGGYTRALDRVVHLGTGACTKMVLLEQAGRSPIWIMRAAMRLPRRIGLHIGPGG